MPINFEQHAIHGTGFQQEWEVVASEGSRAVLRCELAWHFGGFAEQVLELEPTALTCTLAATATDRAMPATVGWHPWFVKPQRAELRFARMYVRDDDYITDGRFVEPPPPPPWDDCFAGPLAPPTLSIGGIDVTLSSDCDFWVVYDMPDYATCVEPQSGLPDAFNLPAEVGGVSHLSPGQRLERTMTISWGA
jgi:aldose 1-epimerase